MAKGNLVNTARELAEQSAEILAKASRARRDADAMFEELKRMDAAIARRKEEAAAQRKREEQIRVQSTHSRAFTMLDEEEKAQMEAALREEREMAARKEQEAAQTPAPAAEAPAPEAVKEAVKPAPKQEEKPAAAPQEEKAAESAPQAQAPQRLSRPRVS